MPNYTLYYFNGRGRAEILRMMFAAAGVKYMDKRFEFNEWDKYRKEMPCMCVPVLEMDGGMKMPETMAIARFLAREYGFYPKSAMDMMRCDYIADCFYEIMHDYMRYYHWKNGRFRFGNNGMMCSDMGNMGSNMMSNSNMGSNMMGSNMMGSSNMGNNMMGNNMMGNSNMGNNMMGNSNMGSNMMGNSNMGSNMMATSNMGNNMMGGNSNDMNSNYDNYMYWRYMNTFNRIMPFMERTLCMRNGGSNFFMGDQMMWCDMMCYCCLENPYMENQSMFSNYPKLMALRTRLASHPKISSYLKNRCNTNW